MSQDRRSRERRPLSHMEDQEPGTEHWVAGRGSRGDPLAEEAAVLVPGVWAGFTLLFVFISLRSSLNLEQYFVKYPNLDSAVLREIEQ